MISVDVRRLGDRNFRKFIAAQPAVANLISSAISKEYAEYLKGGYLSGQVLGKISGETFDSTKFFKMKNGIFGVRPGSGVTGRLNYLHRFERGDRPFMKPSFASFKSSGRPGRIALRIYNAKAKKELGGAV